MALWTYADWITQTDDATRLERLRLHIQEVSQRVLAADPGDGVRIEAVSVGYLNRLQDQERQLESRAGNRGFARTRTRFGR